MLDCARSTRASYYKVRSQLLAAEDPLQQFPPNIAQFHQAFQAQEKQFARAFSIVREAIAQRAFPGATLAIAHQGALIASQGFGQFTYDETSPEVLPDTIYDLASLTKVLATTAMAMLLYERGKLSLEEPLAKTMP